MELREQIVGAVDLPRDRVEVEEWAGADGSPCVVYLQGLSAGHFDAIQKNINTECGGKESNRPNWQAWFLIQVLVTADGTRIFQDGEEALLGGKNSKVIERLYRMAGKQNKVTQEAEEDLIKNSDPIQDEL